MYKYHSIVELIKTTEAAIARPIERHGVGVYVECNPDDVSPDMYIDPADAKGLAIFREFETKILAHYKSLPDGAGSKA